jgi:hypothetical protein
MSQPIFISYRRHDSSFFAAQLKGRLEQAFPGDVFLDVSGIEGGADFVHTLRSAVQSAKVVLVVIGPGWATAGDGRTRLGEPGDFVTEEVATALRAGITTLPVLIGGARMPLNNELPEALRALASRHALSVSHERFDSDAGHVVAALYRPLGIHPPGRLERMLELLPSGARASQRTRDQMAWAALGLAAISAIWVALWAGVEHGEPQAVSTPLAISAGALLLGLIGRNSQRRRWAAWGAMGLAGAALLACLGLATWQAASLPREAWMEAGMMAQVHAHLDELPAEKLAWSPRVPFNTPPPSVECDCLAVDERPASSPPYAAGSRISFSNGCPGPVSFVLSRNAREGLAGAYPWFAAAGREFAVVTLGPKQTLRVPVQGSYSGAVAPWLCPRRAMAQQP